MNELRGKYVNVVLGVEEGKGMDFLKHPVFIVAHFNGRIMESDCVEALPAPDFNTELVWETEKKTIRKVRSTNSPLRVECFSVDEYGKKECIGFALLSLRSANIIPANRPETQIPIKWHKLIGVPAQYKKSHPELYLSLTLRDHCVNNSVPPAIPNFPDSLEAVTESTEKKVIPVKFIDGGYIQVGDDKANEKFELKITVKLASNLDILLPRHLVFAPNADRFYMTFNLFGISINTKPFYRDLHETIILNENIIVKLQSTFDVLKAFFEQFNECTVYFYHGSSQLAYAKINMEKLISSDIQASEFKTKHKGVINVEETCVFKFEAMHPSMADVTGNRKPFIQIDTQISSEIAKTVKVSGKEVVETDSGETIGESPSTSKENIKYMDGCGDRSKKLLSPIRECRIESPKHQIVSDFPVADVGQSTSSDYGNYSFDVIVESLIWRKPISARNFVFKFKHPRASTVLTIRAEIENVLNKNILLESVHCKLIYVSTSENIFQSLRNWKPSLIIQDKHGSRICTEHLFRTEELADRRECCYTSSQMDGGKDVVVDLKVWMCIQNVGLTEVVPKTNYLLEPPILDEFLALKQVHELEKWKTDVKEGFVEELKVKEKEQLDELMKTWTERKNDLENRLIANVKRCKALSKELQRGSNSLKVQKALQQKEQNASLEKIHDEVRKHAIKYSLNGNHELLEKISNLERENDNLKEMLAEQTEEINAIKKSSLSNQQTATLLQEVRCLEEKYMEAQKVKGYFKEQYARAVKEIHQLKTEGQKNIQTQLQVKKEELSQLSLDKFFEMQGGDSFRLNEEILNSGVLKDGLCNEKDEEELAINDTIDYMNTL